MGPHVSPALGRAVARVSRQGLKGRMWSHGTYNEFARVIFLVIGHYYSGVHLAISGNTEDEEHKRNEEKGGMRAQEG